MNEFYDNIYKKIGVNGKRVDFIISADLYALGYAYGAERIKDAPFDAIMTKSFLLGILDYKSGKKFRLKIEGDKREFLKLIYDKNAEKFKTFKGLDSSGRIIYFVITVMVILFGWFLKQTQTEFQRG